MELATRARMAVGAASIEPYGLSPSAVFLVRRMDDPLPRRLLAAPHGLQPSQEWQQAARSRLTELVRKAYRPAADGATLDAPLVVFNDEAEVLACFARDVVRGESGSRWWWRHLIAAARRPGLPRSQELAGAFMERAAAVPAALALLTSWRIASNVLGLLEQAQVHAILRAVAGAFEAPPPPAMLCDAQSGPRGAVTDDTTQRAPTESPGVARFGTTSSLPSDPVLLLAACHTLNRIPQAARATRFWHNVQTLAQSQFGAMRSVPEVRVRATPERDLDSSPPRTQNPASPLARTVEHPARERRVSDRPVEAPLDVPVSTEVAGVFFLINALRSMEIFRLLPPEAGAWTLLEFCGKCLLAGRYPAFAFDPVWWVLRDLAGLEPGVPVPDIAFPRANRRTGRMNAIAMQEIPAGWRRFLGAILPDLRLRLEQALETDDFSDALLLRNGSVYVTRTHLDVMLSQFQISIAVRRAGLDANPGWTPAVGRIVTFHYREAAV